MEIFDVIIIGAGPAGLTASIYASRYKLTNLVIGEKLGGELALTHKVENYPGFISISGLDLAAKWKEQVEKLGAKVLLKPVGKIERVVSPEKEPLGQLSKFSSPPIAERRSREVSISSVAPAYIGGQRKFNSFPAFFFKVFINDQEIYQAKTLIVATGSERRRLNIPGEKEYLGRGVSYCYTCDAAFFKGKVVALIGGSDSAVSGAVHTADYAKKVYIIYRGEALRAEPIWLEEWKKIEKATKGETIFKTNLTEILGDGTKVTGVKLDNPYQGKEVLSLEGVFIEIGGVPGTSLVQPLGVSLDETGHVRVSDKMETNIPGLFCAGDMVNKSATFKQAIWASAQGALAAASAYKYLKKQAAPFIRGV